jgi:hypothetical protein
MWRPTNSVNAASEPAPEYRRNSSASSIMASPVNPTPTLKRTEILNKERRHGHPPRSNSIFAALLCDIFHRRFSMRRTVKMQTLGLWPNLARQDQATGSASAVCGGAQKMIQRGRGLGFPTLLITNANHRRWRGVRPARKYSSSGGPSCGKVDKGGRAPRRRRRPGIWPWGM